MKIEGKLFTFIDYFSQLPSLPSVILAKNKSLKKKLSLHEKLKSPQKSFHLSIVHQQRQRMEGKKRTVSEFFVLSTEVEGN